jgi:prepilin-type N-terminal cleavage/methylation domain-containing protein
VRTRKGFTLIELLVVVAIIALLISILLPSLARARELAKRTVCAANAKGIGTAIATYANENESVWPVAAYSESSRYPSGSGITYIGELDPTPTLARDVMSVPDVAGTTGSTAVSTTRGFWMLVQEGAEAPGQFVCPSSDDTKDTVDQVELVYDFEGINTVSYGIQVPFGTDGVPTDDRDSRMPLVADQGPYGSRIETTDGGSVPTTDLPSSAGMHPDNSTADEWRPFNSPNHGGQGAGEGQNILFADFHAEFMRRPTEGINADNIYLRWPDTVSSDPATARVDIAQGDDSALDASYVKTPASDTDSFIYP